ncbi:SLATT domain-containing protein [Mycobacterium sp. NPDC049093]
MTAALDVFLADLRDAYGRLVYTHKTHEKMAEMKSWRLGAMKIINIVILALTLSAVIADLLSEESDPWFSAVKVLSVSSAAIALIYAFVQLSFDPGGDAVRFRDSAKLFLALRDAYGSLIVDGKSGADLDELRVKRDELAKRKSEVEASSPQTTKRGYKKACQALSGAESVTLTADDITRIFPAELRP